MKANEFVRRFGLNTFRLSAGSVSTRKYLVVYEDEIDFADEIKPSHGKCVFDRLEVKRLVESHDLVINWKLPEDDETGLDGAHLYLDYYATYSNDEEKAKLDRLKQAIADVEACKEVL